MSEIVLTSIFPPVNIQYSANGRDSIHDTDERATPLINSQPAPSGNVIQFCHVCASRYFLTA